jgi:hypothetical protein
VRFRRDESKNTANFREHGLWFEEAQTVWTDSLAAEFFDPEHSAEEERFIRVGYSRKQRLLLVVFCEREDGSTVRIISARKATAKESKTHEEGI